MTLPIYTQNAIEMIGYEFGYDKAYVMELLKDCADTGWLCYNLDDFQPEDEEGLLKAVRFLMNNFSVSTG